MKHFVLAAAAAATVMVAGAAQAATVTYATFGPLPAEPDAPQTLSYTNAGATAGGTLTNNGVQQVMFWFTGMGLPASLTGGQLAYFNLNAVSTTAATPAGANWDQIFQNGTVNFTRTTSAGVGSGTGTNLLSINFTNFVLSGEPMSDSPGGRATTLSASAASTMTITSDFYDFSGLTSSNFSFSMTAATPTLSLGSNGSFDSFTADAGGLFASNPAPTYVPEPAMLGLFGMGAITLGLARRRKK